MLHTVGIVKPNDYRRIRPGVTSMEIEGPWVLLRYHDGRVELDYIPEGGRLLVLPRSQYGHARTTAADGCSVQTGG